MGLQLEQCIPFLSLDMVFHVCPLAENHLALPLAQLLLKSCRCMVVKFALLQIFPLGGKVKTCRMVQNLFSGVMMTVAILRTWIRISMTTALRSVTLTDVRQRVGGGELGHRDDSEEVYPEEKKSGLSVRFADMPGKSRKKKNMKDLTPLQAMMLRMAGQEIPEEGQEVEEFSEEEEDEDSGDSESESSGKSSIKRTATLMAHLLPLHNNRLLHSLPLLLRSKHLPSQDHHLLDHCLSHPYGLLDHLQGLLRS
ncbi:uncharacterized protein LOC129668974 [Psammomys obesus]|uniref:uncharacterized protein LOC129668974 n=1 Tax=Psammomys obesus TaxID=48139 RepID=UPI00245327DE|nr:uncharacterized protein LOC129668974 [Psammomys obesus]